ncbi:MAG: hypothetical protein JJE40_18445 [Vicinamibacteria bacterium]|nr:hypothetical protein [Vicinamibacteria bacterium]
MVEAGTIQFVPSQGGAAREDRNDVTADQWLANGGVATSVEERVQDSDARVIAIVSVIQRQIGAGCLTSQGVPMNHRLRGRMLVMHMQRGQQRQRPDADDGAGRNDESDPS